MARLPSEQYLMQQLADGEVWLFEDGSERQVTRFDPANSIDTASALEEIRASDLSDEDKSFACFWAGYFHAYAGPGTEMMRTEKDVQQADDGQVFVMDGPVIVASFDPGDANAAAQAQKLIHDYQGLSRPDRDRAHFWSGFFYAKAS